MLIVNLRYYYVGNYRLCMFTLAAEKGHTDAIYALGMCYRDSDGVDEDPVKVHDLISEEAKIIIARHSRRRLVYFARQLTRVIVMRSSSLDTLCSKML